MSGNMKLEIHKTYGIFQIKCHDNLVFLQGNIITNVHLLSKKMI